ncbi:hypothetical protein OKW50_008001 [Paraburkholderia youngii]|uniref:hypothetical protein n=1 Tax=Paraburkholderia youngii TaxID=2782701 RepID=UPI003D1B3713
MALDGLEDAVRSGLGSSKTARQPAKAHVVRYADDFIVTGANQELLEQRVKPAIEAFLSARGCNLRPRKRWSRILHEGSTSSGKTCANTGTSF